MAHHHFPNQICYLYSAPTCLCWLGIIWSDWAVRRHVCEEPCRSLEGLENSWLDSDIQRRVKRNMALIRSMQIKGNVFQTSKNLQKLEPWEHVGKCRNIQWSPNNGFAFQSVPSKPSPIITSCTQFPGVFHLKTSQWIRVLLSVQRLEHNQPMIWPSLRTNPRCIADCAVFHQILGRSPWYTVIQTTQVESCFHRNTFAI